MRFLPVFSLLVSALLFSFSCHRQIPQKSPEKIWGAVKLSADYSLKEGKDRRQGVVRIIGDKNENSLFVEISSHGFTLMQIQSVGDSTSIKRRDENKVECVQSAQTFLESQLGISLSKADILNLIYNPEPTSWPGYVLKTGSPSNFDIGKRPYRLTFFRGDAATLSLRVRTWKGYVESDPSWFDVSPCQDDR